jgi:nucleotide-binding universal stress UspA family protein
LTRILLPVDFSGRSLGAARLTRALATRFGSAITMLHVIPPPHYELSVLEDGASVLAEAHAAHARQARQDLHTHLAAELEGAPVERVLTEGDPARTIVETAHQRNVDLIVMPTHGYGPFRRFLLGSVTAKVLHDAGCPVLTGVHLEDIPAGGAVLSGRVLAAVDLGPGSVRVLEWAAWLAAGLSAGLSAIHVVGGAPPTPPARRGPGAPARPAMGARGGAAPARGAAGPKQTTPR